MSEFSILIVFTGSLAAFVGVYFLRKTKKIAPIQKEIPSPPIMALPKAMVPEKDPVELEMQLTFAKSELTKIVKENPSIACRAAEEYFALGKINETTLYLEALGWENSRKIFKEIDTQLWSRIGLCLRERDRDPTAEETYHAVHVFHRFILSFVLERAGRDQDNPFSFLFHLEDSERIDLLSQEDPLNIAFISIYSSGAQMAEILTGLKTETQLEVLIQVSKIKFLPEAQIKECVDSLLLRLERIKADPTLHVNGPVLAVDFLKNLDPSREEELFQTLLFHYPDDAEKLRHVRVMFTDIPKYPSDMTRNILETLDAEEILCALVGLPQAFVETFVSLLPAKKAHMIQNDLKQMSEKPPLSICAEKRRKIANKVNQEFEIQRFSVPAFWKSIKKIDSISENLAA